jgi:hypothetical protein
VDTNKYRIPNYVTHVPTVITRQKEIINDVSKYIESLNISSDSISPFSLATTTGYSSSYTWLTENGYDNDGVKSEDDKNAYLLLTGMTDTRIVTPKEPETSTKSVKFDDTMYERYINNRNADDEVLKRQMR